MTGERSWIAGLAVLTAPVALVPLFLRPEVALALGVCGAVAWAAWRSVAYPLALAAVPPIAFGIFGNNPLPEGVVGIALACAVLLSIACAVQRQERIPPPAILAGAPLLLSILILCALVLRQPPDPDTNYGELKTGFFAVNNLVFLIGGIFVGWSAIRLRLLLLTTLVVSVAGGALLVLHVAAGGVESILPVAVTFSDGDHSISMGRQMAAGVLVALAIVLGREDAPGRFVAAASLPLLAAALLASGSRGPIVALLVGSAVLLLLGLPDREARRRLAIVASASAVAALVVATVVPSASIVRSFSFATTDVEGTSSGRIEMWSQAWRIISERPELGIGTGGFAEINPVMIYPHNILLEAGVELGVAGALLVAAFLGLTAWRLATAYRRAPFGERVTVAAVLALFGAAVTNAMFSFAIHSNWEVWMWAGVGAALAARVVAERSPRAPAPRTR